MAKITWVLINCNSKGEADRIGKALLRKRRIACYDIILRSKAAYFWPPRSGKIETAKGALLIVVTLPVLASKLIPFITKLHSDKLPFIGKLHIDTTAAYAHWVRGEVKK